MTEFIYEFNSGGLIDCVYKTVLDREPTTVKFFFYFVRWKKRVI